MELDVRERFILLNVLPQEGNFATLKVTRDLQDKLSFTEEEHKLYGFAYDDGKVTWNNLAEQAKEIELGEKATEIITEALKMLDEQKKLRQDQFTVYEKFIDKKEKNDEKQD